MGLDAFEWLLTLSIFGVCRCVEDYELSKQLYKGKASLLFAATCQRSRMPVALKLYRKSKLSDLNWYQASHPAQSQKLHENLQSTACWVVGGLMMNT